MSADHSHEQPASGGRLRWVFWGFALIAAYFLITEHRAHVFQYLPILLLLGCVAMHLFGHGGHEGHGGQAGKESDEPRR
jgi:hypothetical protein